jgi:hypothetical protein
MVKITLPDNSVRAFEEPVSGHGAGTVYFIPAGKRCFVGFG